MIDQIPKTWRCVGGTHAINEALKINGKKSRLLVLRDDYESSQDLKKIFDQASRFKIKTQLRHRGQLEKIFNSNQGALLYVEGQPEFKIDSMDGPSVVVILDGLEDPHNLGAIIRTSWLMGVKGILIPQDRSVQLTPTVHKVASGGVEHVPVLATGNFDNIVSQLKEKGFWVYGLAGGSQQSIYQLKLAQKIILIIGSEDKGMRKTTSRICDELIELPQVSADASYNASVAAAIGLAECFRQIGEQY
ncbi:MAG: 23S rRNA (guanosine(2251)-2'-O)-methyltransferase RlmB [Pseudobdellovibrionaceae bacterium]